MLYIPSTCTESVHRAPVRFLFANLTESKRKNFPENHCQASQNDVMSQSVASPEFSCDPQSWEGYVR